MGQLDTQVYILQDQRELDKAEQIRWYYRLPTYGDTMACQRFARSEQDPDESAQLFGVARIACCLERTEGVLRGRQPAEIPAELPLADRVAWVLRLPTAWVVELAAQVAKESDLDPEDE
jgi:hypothetical protein